MEKNFTKAKLDFVTATINSGETVSNVVDLVGMTLCGFYMPTTFTGTAITFQASGDKGQTYLNVEDGAGSNVSKTVSASKYIKIDPSDFAGIQYLKLVSGATEGADRNIILALREV